MTGVLPRPKAATGVVFHDVGTRTLTVRLSEQESGYTKLLWREGWQALRRDQETGCGFSRYWSTRSQLRNGGR